jgi:hypothetical protein
MIATRVDVLNRYYAHKHRNRSEDRAENIYGLFWPEDVGRNECGQGGDEGAGTKLRPWKQHGKHTKGFELPSRSEGNMTVLSTLRAACLRPEPIEGCISRALRVFAAPEQVQKREGRERRLSERRRSGGAEIMWRRDYDARSTYVLQSQASGPPYLSALFIVYDLTACQISISTV